jgi:hypothetical protein
MKQLHKYYSGICDSDQQVSRKGAKEAKVAKPGPREICGVAMLTGNAIWTIIYALAEERS